MLNALDRKITSQVDDITNQLGNYDSAYNLIFVYGDTTKLNNMAVAISEDILEYNSSLSAEDKAICYLLVAEITQHLPDAENKIWHRHPVWFLDGNPIVGYSKEKRGLRLMFWSGAGFEEDALNVKGKKFKDASIFYKFDEEVDTDDLKRWLQKSRNIQWDYKNIVKRKGVLERLKI